MRNELNYTDIAFASRISVDNMSRAFLSTYIPGATDYINAVFVDASILSYGLFTFTVDLDSDLYPDSDPILTISSLDRNLNQTPCSVKSTVWYDVAIWFAV